MLPTGMPRFVQAATSMLSNPTAKLLTTLSCGPAAVEELVVDAVREQRQDAVAALDRAQEVVARRRQLVLPDRPRRTPR